MIVILHTYYPPDDSILRLLENHTLLWTHSGEWKEEWNSIYSCKDRYTISNRGKDIGGKLFAFKVLLENNWNEEYALFLHDKKSPQMVNGTRWKQELWSISQKNKIEEIIDRFENHSEVGIIAGKNTIMNPKVSGENYVYGLNKPLISEEAVRYGIEVEDTSYVAGTTFALRLAPYLDFFRKNDPLLIRGQLETGNVLDLHKATYTHSWERLLSWIPVSKGMTIEGI